MYAIRSYYAKGTADFYKNNGIEMEVLNRPYDNEEPSIMSYLEAGKVDSAIYEKYKYNMAVESLHSKVNSGKATAVGSVATEIKLPTPLTSTVSRRRTVTTVPIGSDPLIEESSYNFV